jgi:hypothetical protein
MVVTITPNTPVFCGFLEQQSDRRASYLNNWSISDRFFQRREVVAI